MSCSNSMLVAGTSQIKIVFCPVCRDELQSPILIAWSIDWLIDWLIDWGTYRPIDWRWRRCVQRRNTRAVRWTEITATAVTWNHLTTPAAAVASRLDNNWYLVTVTTVTMAALMTRTWASLMVTSAADIVVDWVVTVIQYSMTSSVLPPTRTSPPRRPRHRLDDAWHRTVSITQSFRVSLPLTP